MYTQINNISDVNLNNDSSVVKNADVQNQYIYFNSSDTNNTLKNKYQIYCTQDKNELYENIIDYILYHNQKEYILVFEVKKEITNRLQKLHDTKIKVKKLLKEAQDSAILSQETRIQGTRILVDITVEADKLAKTLPYKFIESEERLLKKAIDAALLQFINNGSTPSIREFFNKKKYKENIFIKLYKKLIKIQAY